MKKVSIKACVAAVSLTLALTPLGFAQSPSAGQPSANTQPLPGAKLAAQFVEGGSLTALGAGVVVAALALGIVVSSNASNDDLAAIAAFLAAQKTGTSTR